MKLTEHARQVIETWRLGYVASVSPDGRPNLSPKGTFVIVDDDMIAFAEMRSPATIANVKVNPEVEINFVDILSRKGIRIRGQAQIHAKGSENYAGLEPLFVASWPELRDHFRHAVCIAIEDIRPLTSPIYDVGAEEADLRSLWKLKINAL